MLPLINLVLIDLVLVSFGLVDLGLRQHCLVADGLSPSADDIQMARKHGPEQRARVGLPRVDLGKRPAIAEFSKEGFGGAALTCVRWPTLARWRMPRHQLCRRCVVLQSAVHALLSTGLCRASMRCRALVKQSRCRFRIQPGLCSTVAVALVALLPAPLVAARAAPRLEDVRRPRLLDAHLLLEQH